MDLKLNTRDFTIQKQKYGSKIGAIYTSSPSFKGKTLAYTQDQIEKIARNVDNILGNDKFFSSKLNAAGIKPEAGKVIIKDEGLFEGVIKTLKYPFVDMPLDIANWALKALQKTPLKESAQKLSNNSVLQKRAAAVEHDKSFKLVQDLLSEYFPNADEIDKAGANFKNKVTNGITKTVKNYESRDERTLNRMVTSTVSALYSGRDFYNISMLQKDDKEEAKKAEKSRFKQEMTRMAFSAGLTFLTLGALDKYVKKNIVANSVVIALSALISEVGSRIISHTPLRPLSPEQAAKYAQKKNIETTSNEKKENDKPIAFKSRQEEIFSQFASKDGSFAALNALNSTPKTPVENEGKKSSTLKKLLIAMGASSLFYLLSKGAKGEFSAKIARKQLYSANKDKINNFVNSKADELSSDIIKTINDISKKQSDTAKKVNLFDKLKDFITTGKKEIQLPELRASLVSLKDSKEGSEISNLLNEYISHTDSLLNSGSDVITTSVARPVLPGVYNGVTKIFKTVYQILSTPGALINGVVNKLFFNESEKAVLGASKKLDLTNTEKLNKGYKKEAAELTRLFKKYDNAGVVDKIKRSTRNFETSSETGELANLSRTMVTAISTYFFVNDYTNKVLIESGGKDVDKAKEERNERIAHKLSNFVINGTLMNLFNSVFKTPLNDSLIKASLIAGATEMTNEFLVRKSICQPVGRKDSKQAIIDYEEQQMNKKGIMGAWSRLFRKMTGKKTLTQKAGIVTAEDKK